MSDSVKYARRVNLTFYTCFIDRFTGVGANLKNRFLNFQRTYFTDVGIHLIITYHILINRSKCHSKVLWNYYLAYVFTLGTKISKSVLITSCQTDFYGSERVFKIYFDSILFTLLNGYRHPIAKHLTYQYTGKSSQTICKCIRF